MSSQLTQPSPSTARTSSAHPSRHRGALGLEAQSTAVFVVALVIGVAAVVVSMPFVASVALIAVAVAISTRALSVLALNPAGPQIVRPRELANWDGAFAAALAGLAIVFVATFATGAAYVAAVGAISIAALRLLTRYVKA